MFVPQRRDEELSTIFSVDRSGDVPEVTVHRRHRGADARKESGGCRGVITKGIGDTLVDHHVGLPGCHVVRPGIEGKIPYAAGGRETLVG